MTTRLTFNDAYVWTGDVNVSRNYAANGLSQHTSAGPPSFSYDADGNLTGDGSSAFAYVWLGLNLLACSGQGRHA